MNIIGVILFLVLFCVTCDLVFNYMPFEEKAKRNYVTPRTLTFKDFKDEYNTILSQNGWTLDHAEFFSGRPDSINENNHFWKYDVVLNNKHCIFKSYIEYRKFVNFYERLTKECK